MLEANKMCNFIEERALSIGKTLGGVPDSSEVEFFREKFAKLNYEYKGLDDSVKGVYQDKLIKLMSLQCEYVNLEHKLIVCLCKKLGPIYQSLVESKEMEMEDATKTYSEEAEFYSYRMKILGIYNEVSRRKCIFGENTMCFKWCSKVCDKVDKVDELMIKYGDNVPFLERILEAKHTIQFLQTFIEIIDGSFENFPFLEQINRLDNMKFSYEEISILLDCSTQKVLETLNEEQTEPDIKRIKI